MNRLNRSLKKSLRPVEVTIAAVLEPEGWNAPQPYDPGWAELLLRLLILAPALVLIFAGQALLGWSEAVSLLAGVGWIVILMSGIYFFFSLKRR